MQEKMYTLPVHWASAMVNGDTSGFDDREQAQYDAFCRDMDKQYLVWHCVDVFDESTNFLRFHDAHTYGVLACDAAPFMFHVEEA